MLNLCAECHYAECRGVILTRQIIDFHLPVPIMALGRASTPDPAISPARKRAAVTTVSPCLAASWCHGYKTFLLRHWWRGLISYSIFPCKPFPVRSYNLRARPQQTQMEELSDASLLGKLLVLPSIVRLDWKVIARYRHSSLFGLIISNEEKKFYNIDS